MFGRLVLAQISILQKPFEKFAVKSIYWKDALRRPHIRLQQMKRDRIANFCKFDPITVD